MATSRKRGWKRKGKIKFKQSASLVQRSDKTRVNIEKGNTAGLRRMPAQMPRDVGVNFKIKIRKK